MVRSEDEIGFSLGEVEAVLASMFGIDTIKRATFNARLQQLQRMGLPPGANQGRGKRFRYQNWQLAEFALYLDLLDAGVPPSLIKVHMEDGGYYSMGGGGQKVEAAPPTAEGGVYLFLQLNALDYLRRSDPSAQPAPGDHLWTFGPAPGLMGVQRPAVVINLSRRLADLRNALREVLPDRAVDRLFPSESPRPGMIA